MVGVNLAFTDAFAMTECFIKHPYTLPPPSYSEKGMHTVHLVTGYSVFCFLSLFTPNSSDVFIVRCSNLVLETEWLFNSTCQPTALECFTNTNCYFPNILVR